MDGIKHQLWCEITEDIEIKCVTDIKDGTSVERTTNKEMGR